MNLRCMNGIHDWTPETHGTYFYCSRCRKYNLWRGRKWR